MRTRPSSKMALTILPLFMALTMAEYTHERFHSHKPVLRRAQYAGTEQGCFTSAGGSAESQGTDIYQSSATCGNICAGLNKPVMALSGGNECTCADLLPAASSQTDASACSDQCTGYTESCGGDSAYTVWLTGVNDSIGAVSGGSDTDSASSAVVMSSVAAVTSVVAVSSSKAVVYPSVVKATSVVTSKATKVATPEPTTVVEGQKTVVKTLIPTVQTVAATAASSPSNNDSGSGTNTVAIAVGVVVGVVVIAAIIALSFYCIRRRRQLKNAVNGHARADSLNAFVASGGTLPGVVPLANDTRLDPRMMVERRRQSTGSVFADNEDYSRRILKVTNPHPDNE